MELIVRITVEHMHGPQLDADELIDLVDGEMNFDIDSDDTTYAVKGIEPLEPDEIQALDKLAAAKGVR